MTLTRSARGCMCGGIVYPSGTFTRNTNGPSFAGSPSSTVICAPGGSEGGPGFHVCSSGGCVLNSFISEPYGSCVIGAASPAFLPWVLLLSAAHEHRSKATTNVRCFIDDSPY